MTLRRLLSHRGFYRRIICAGITLFLFSGSLSLGAYEADPAERSLLNPLRKYHQFKLLRPFLPELNRLVERLKKEEGASEVAVYFRALNDGVWIGVNERVLFAPASLLKVPMMLVYLKQAESDPGLLQREFPVDENMKYVQYISSGSRLEKGKKYTVNQLIDAMIRDSNNDAFRVLSLHADPTVTRQMYRQFGFDGTFTEETDFVSLKNYAGTLRSLYNASFLNEAMSEKALRLLAGANFKGGISAGVPEDVTVAHKFGEYNDVGAGIKQLHDVGIVYLPDNSYILGVMTRGDDYEKLRRIIEKISSFVYKEVDRQYKGHTDPDFEFKFDDEG